MSPKQLCVLAGLVSLGVVFFALEEPSKASPQKKPTQTTQSEVPPQPISKKREAKPTPIEEYNRLVKFVVAAQSPSTVRFSPELRTDVDYNFFWEGTGTIYNYDGSNNYKIFRKGRHTVIFKIRYDIPRIRDDEHNKHHLVPNQGYRHATTFELVFFAERYPTLARKCSLVAFSHKNKFYHKKYLFDLNRYSDHPTLRVYATTTPSVENRLTYELKTLNHTIDRNVCHGLLLVKQVKKKTPVTDVQSKFSQDLYVLYHQ